MGSTSDPDRIGSKRQSISPEDRLLDRSSESEERFQSILRLSSDGYFTLEGTVATSVNAAGVDLLRAPGAEQVVGRSVLELFDSKCHQRLSEAIGNLTKEPGSIPVRDEVMLAMDGMEVPVEMRASSHLVNGRLTILVNCRDISDRKALKEKTALFEAQLESSVDGILVVDADGQKVIQNRRMIELWRIPQDIADNPSKLPQLDFVASRTKNPEAFLGKVHWLVDHPDEVSRDEIELDDGTILDRYSAPVLDQDGRNYGRIWSFRDITETRQAQNQIRHLAHYDTLTGLPNRHTFRAKLQERLEQPNARFSLIFIDLDGFKPINDTKGHGTGDELLKQVAMRLSDACGEPEHFIARLGGDEFAGLIPYADPRLATNFTTSLVGILSAPYWLGDDRQLLIGASIGVALVPEHGDTTETLLSRADIALYAAKAAGKGTAKLFTVDMEESILDRIQIETGLRAALDNLDGVFVFYQPIVDIKTRQVTAREALIRWHDPERGWVSPVEFIPVAEMSGLIDKVGAFVLNRACRDAAGWENGTRVSVNVSACQLGKGTLAPVVAAALAASRLSPDRLEIEVTESALLSDEAETIADLRQVREMGVRVALDDFGTGFSSLSHLRMFPFDKIKIDGSFVRDAIDRPDCAAVVKAVADLGQRLGVTTVAEGVETEAQLDRVREEGCAEVQGYVYGRPVPNEADAPLVAALNEKSRRPAAA